MKNLTINALDLTVVLLLHILTVAILGGIAMFVWNVGAVNLLPNLSEIDYLVAVAVITGIYVADLWIKTYINKAIAYKQQKNIQELLFNDKDKM